MVLEVALLGGGVFAERTEELPWVQVQFHVFFKVAAISGFVFAVRTGQRFGAIVNLTGVTCDFMLVCRQIVTALTFERTLTWKRRRL